MRIEIATRLMATSISIHLEVAPEQETIAQAAINSAIQWLDETAQRFTRFTHISELSQFNDAAGQWIDVSSDFFIVVEAACIAAKNTDGLFDPTLLPIIEALGYDRDFSQIAYQEANTEWKVRNDLWQTKSWEKIEFDPSGQRIFMPANVKLDLSGLVKGWAADIILDRFLCDFEHALINIGGDMRVRGGPESGQTWAIGIGDNSSISGSIPEIAVITLGKGGLATSGATTRWWYRAGERQHHIIDPRTRKAARIWIDEDDTPQSGYPLIVTSTALASTSAQAEVAAKVAILRGYPLALEVVESAWKSGTQVNGYDDFPVALLLLLSDGQVVTSTNFNDYLQRFGGNGQIWIS
jgi:thiamine biosynthesis lipoprotein